MHGPGDERDPVDDLIEPSEEVLDLSEEIEEEETDAQPDADVEVDGQPKQKAGKSPEGKGKPNGKGKRDYVPLAKFLDEKNKLTKELSERASAEKASQDRIKKLEEELNSIKNPPPPTPEFDKDPKAYIDHRAKESAKDILTRLEKAEKEAGELKKTAEEGRAEAQNTRLFQEIANHEQTFVAAQPDYMQALQYMRNARVEQLREIDPDLTDEVIGQSIMREELALAATMLQKGRNPAQVIYNMAKRIGYRPKDAEGEDLTPPTTSGRRRLPPDQTLGSSGGRPPRGDDDEILDPEKHDPFEAAFNEMFKAKGRK